MGNAWISSPEDIGSKAILDWDIFEVCCWRSMLPTPRIRATTTAAVPAIRRAAALFFGVFSRFALDGSFVFFTCYCLPGLSDGAVCLSWATDNTFEGKEFTFGLESKFCFDA